MGRPSKLSDKQWAEFEKRLIEGEKQADLCREYGVTKQSASARFAGRKEIINNVANQIVNANRQLMNLDESGQTLAVKLAKSLMTISENMAQAAISGSYTSMRLSQIAANQVEKIDDENPMKSVAVLQTVSTLTKISNDASVIPRSLLESNARKPVKSEEETAQPLTLTIIDASADAQ